MSTSDKQAVNAIHQRLMERFPNAFPKDYDRIIPLKVGIHTDLVARLPEIDSTRLRRALANHTQRAGYLLALLHHRGDQRYDLDGQPVGIVTPEERTQAQTALDAATQRGQNQAKRRRVHKEREEKRRLQREIQRKNREAKAARKAEHERIQQEIAARKAALAAQGMTVESRSERKRRLIREAIARAEARRKPSQEPNVPTRQPPPPPTPPSPARHQPTLRLKSKSEGSPVTVEYKKRRRAVPPKDND